MEAIRTLFLEYEASLEIDLGYRDFASELAAIPGKYAPPSGELILARSDDGRAIGCGALRPLDPTGCCEMKRLYVTPEGRGSGLGKALIGTLVGIARRIGYREMWLDTLPSMTAAQHLYRAVGFEVTDPYYDTPVAGTVFMRLKLGASEG